MIVLSGEPIQGAKIVVGKSTLERYRASFGQIDMLIHPAVFDARHPAPPDPQHNQREATTMTDELSLEDRLPVQGHSIDLCRQAGQSSFDLFRQIGLHDFIRIQPHHPITRDRRVLHGPSEMPSMILERVLQYRRPRRPRNIDGVVR